MNIDAMHRVLPLALAWAATCAIANEDPMLKQAREVASSVPPKLLAVLQEEIARGGPEGAIGVCRDKAPQMAREASERTGWNIRRVSLKNRNPKAVPDAWERAVLEEFDRRAAAGENAAGLEKGEIVTIDGQRYYRYMKALPTQPLCTNCHGPQDQLSPAVKAKLAQFYPNDRATGYTPGQIRGAMTIKRPL
ncbi:MAG: DUF3365 domain-containing protein [Burkholderiaceae bacterium]